MKVIFETPREVVIIPEVKRTISEIEVIEITDSPQRKSVIAMTDSVGMVILWEGAEYDAIGQWTNDDVVARINELYV